jgi:uncharacterized membrane protein YcaP (DUF421 family)
MFEAVDWSRLFAIDTSLLEIFLRGTFMYLGLFVILRVVSKRQAGTLGIADLLVITLLADAAQNGMAGDYVSITDGLLLVSVIVFWSFAIDFLGFRFKAMRKLLEPPTLEIVRRGRILREPLDREFVSEEELLSQLRQHGVEHVKDVKAAYMESDGHVSVIRRKPDDGDDEAGGRRPG